MNSITSKQINIDLSLHGNGFHFEHEGKDCVLPSMDKVHAFFQEKCFDTVKFFHDGKREYHHFTQDEVVVFESKEMLRKTLSQEGGDAWVEEKDGKKRYFVDDSGWFNTSYKQVSKEEYLQRVGSLSTMQRVLGIGLGILALLPGALKIQERLPLKASEAGMGLFALQHKSPLFGALGFSLLPSSVEAQAVGTEFQVNNYTTNLQGTPTIAPLNDGGFVVTWDSDGQDGNSWGTFAQRYDASGSLFGSEFQVNNYTTGDQEFPAIAPLNDGGFVVAWESNGQDGDGWGIFAQRYNATGAILGSEFQVNNYTTSDQQRPAKAPLNDGGFVVAWYSNGQDGNSWGIFAQVYDASGALLGSELQVNNYTTSSQRYPAITPLSDGGFVVTWQSSGQDGDLDGIFAQRYDNTGAIVSSEFQVNNYTISSQQFPKIAPLNDGGFVVAWQSSGQDGDLDGIFAQRYDASGVLFGSEFQVNNYTTSSQSKPALTPLNDGGFVVVWQSSGQDGDLDGIFGQRYDASGSLFGSEFQVNNYTTSSQSNPAIAPLNDGGFVVVWQSSGQDGDLDGIFGQRYDQGGNPVPLTYLPSISSASALSSNASTTNFPSSQLSPTNASTTGNSVLSSSPISNTPSSSTSAPLTNEGVTTPSTQVESSGIASSMRATTTSLRPSSQLSSIGSSADSSEPSSITSLPPSSTSGMQTTLLPGSSSPSNFEIPVLVDIVYGESYSITQNGQVIGTYIISGGDGLYSNGNDNVLEIQLDPNYELQDGDTVTLFTVPDGEEPQIGNVVVTGRDDECVSAEGVFAEEQQEHSFQLVFVLETDSCIINEGTKKLSVIPVLASGGLI